jgi:hypothetical protein
MKHTLFILATSFLMVSCGSSGSSDGSTTSESSSEDINLTLGERYTAYADNRLVANSDDTIVRILHTDKAKTSTLILLEGSATLIRNP